MDFLIYVNESSPLPVPSGQGVTCIPTNLESLLLDFWPEANWRKEYAKRLENNHSSTALRREGSHDLLCCYLGKFTMISKALDMGYTHVLWIDAGHAVSFFYDHDIYRYVRYPMNGERMVEAVNSLCGSYDLLLAHRKNQRISFHMSLTSMLLYAKEFGLSSDRLRWYWATFMLVSQNAVQDFVNGCRYWWFRLMKDGLAGTEENAMTLYAWNNYDIKSFALQRWMSELGIKV